MSPIIRAQLIDWRSNTGKMSSPQHYPQQPYPQPPPVRRKGMSTIAILGIVVAVCCGIGMITAIINTVFDGGDDTPASTAPALQLTAYEQLTAAVNKELGKPNRDGAPPSLITAWPDDPQKTIDVQWAINDNLTKGLLRDGARLDVVGVIRAVKSIARWKYTDLRLKATFSMADKYGNASESVVIDLIYSAETIAKINPDGVSLDRIYELADSGFVHPEFR